MMTETPNAWVTVNRTSLRHNQDAVRRLITPEGEIGPRLIAVVKANAFGHGAVETARTFQEAGADFFAVTTLAEAVELRDAGITGRILVFLPPLPEQWESIVAGNFDATVWDEAGVRGLAQAARLQGKIVRVHLKVDTGMGRLGVMPDMALPLGKMLAGEAGIEFAGIYTHFARALEADEASVHRQFALFTQVVSRLREDGIDVGMRHCANSAALARFPEMRLDAVRPGTILYGQYPSEAVPRLLDLRETWKLQARIVAVRDMARGASIGYGGEFVTRRASRLAVLPIGYADGFAVVPASQTQGMRGLKAWAQSLRGPGLTVTVRGKRVPVVGRVAMQICMADVTDVAGVEAGDVATIPARRLMASARLARVYED